MRSAPLVVVLTLLAASAQAGSVKTSNTAGGPILTDEHGMTLYTFDRETDGKVVCVDGCAQSWPPLLADAMAHSASGFSLVKRPDGAMQWAHKGSPLYLWVKDTKPGDMTGDGFKDMWHVAKP